MISLKRTRQAAAKILRMLEEREEPLPAWKLSYAAGFEGDRTHRDTRRAVGYLTDLGYPVVHVHGQGYRLAREPGEVREYIDKMHDMIEALNYRIKSVCSYTKLYAGKPGYIGRVHGPYGAMMELMEEGA